MLLIREDRLPGVAGRSVDNMCLHAKQVYLSQFGGSLKQRGGDGGGI